MRVKLSSTRKADLQAAGFFAVHHEVGSDRLINDRRPVNSIENRLGWAKLPHWALFCQVNRGGERVKSDQVQ